LSDAMPDQDYELFVRKVKAHTGIDLAQYKEAQMKRRLTTLRLKRGYSTFVSYFQALVQDRELMREFLDRMTINVSEFWRNPNRWEMLEQRFIPELVKERGFRLKCWSAACSTGEEPYTLAMILAEHKLLAHARIIASDIDEGALAKAKEGVYPDRSVKDVPPRYLKTYFVQDSAQQYRVVPELKQAVRWEKKNLLLDPFESDFDLIICRNVVIYFTEEAKHGLYQRFADALRPGGLLFVGSTEQIFHPQQYGLQPVETFFYQKTVAPSAW
jgi:Methylase of chemotaxis methyl-accepting proteins